MLQKSFKKGQIFFGIYPKKLEKAWWSKLELTSLAWTFKSSSIKLLVPLLVVSRIETLAPENQEVDSKGGENTRV